MITLDQVLLLQEKVESAVAKIEQLKAENAALRSKCAELTNALSAKTEQFSTFEADQNKIEHGILQALERLNAVENAVVQAASTVAQEANVPQSAAEDVAEQPVATEQGADAQPQEQAYEAPQATAEEQPVGATEAAAEPAPQGGEQADASVVAEQQQVAEAAEPQMADAQEAPAPDTAQGQFDIF